MYDNYLCNEGLETSHGLSSLIEGIEKTILFDTGRDGRMLLSNMEKLGVNPKAVDVIVLSHAKKRIRSVDLVMFWQ